MSLGPTPRGQNQELDLYRDSYDHLTAENKRWLAIADECCKIFKCPDKTESSTTSNLANLVRDIVVENKALVEEVKEVRHDMSTRITDLAKESLVLIGKKVGLEHDLEQAKADVERLTADCKDNLHYRDEAVVNLDRAEKAEADLAVERECSDRNDANSCDQIHSMSETIDIASKALEMVGGDSCRSMLCGVTAQKALTEIKER